MDKIYLLVFILLSTSLSAQEQFVKVKPTVAVHGRIMYDYEFMNREGIVDSLDTHISATEFRRLYLSASGTIYKNIKYKAQLEFAGSKIGYRDVHIKFVELPFIGGNFKIGSFSEKTGLSAATSSKYIPMLERAMLTNTKDYSWNSGLMYDNMKLFGGKLGLQVSYAHNAKDKEGFKDIDLARGGHWTMRLTSPIYVNKEKRQLIHIGAKFENHKRSQKPANYTMKFRPDNHLGNKIAVVFTDLEVQRDFGLEFLTIIGPFSAQAEYEIASYTTKDKDLKVNGYYGLISYFFGGHRGYKNGSVGRVNLYNNLDVRQGQYGALEVVMRYSIMDFTDLDRSALRLPNVIDHEGKVGSLGIGLNWYMNNHTRLMYNFNTANFHEKGNTAKLNASLVRLQVDF